MGFLSRLFKKVKPLSSGLSQPMSRPRSGLGGLLGRRFNKSSNVRPISNLYAGMRPNFVPLLGGGLFNPRRGLNLSRGFLSNPLDLNNFNFLIKDKLRQSPTPLIPGLMPGMGDDQTTDEPLPGEMPSNMPSLDIMPRDAVLPKQPPQIGVAPAMTRGNAALLPPDIAPLPPKPMMGVNMGMPNFISSGQMPKTVVGMKDGGDMDAEEMNKEYPNKGLAALAASGPGGRKAVKAMGFANGMEVVANPIPGIDMPSGSDADKMNYQNALMNYTQFFNKQPLNIQKILPTPEAVMANPSAFMSLMQQENMRSLLGEEGREMSNMMGGMPMPQMEKKSLNPPMMSPFGM